ncbi:MAG: DUF4923 family protein [Lachnospiraceae bacterium]|nr:DUF4923 family protein [Lachnospiraceae bacterium]
MKKKLAALALIAVMITGCLSGCSGYDGPLKGDWSYIHDKETTVLSIDQKGKATYKDQKYKCTPDDEFINLSGNGENLKLRYELNDDGFYLYEGEIYNKKSEGEDSSLTGTWIKKDNNWAFEFDENGVFKEGVEEVSFSGHYTVDEDNKIITLQYDDRLEFDDTKLYYELDGNELHIEYPTQMVVTGSGDPGAQD